MTAYTITNNAAFGSKEITFNGIPSKEIREALKALKFRWHGVKKLWYGYAEESELEKICGGSTEKILKTEKEAPKKEKAQPVNKFGVKVGDFFSMSWGYEQTNQDFFQVIALVGASSVRIRQVDPPLIAEDAISGMSADRTYRLDTSKILPPSSHTVFINDQEKGDLKRLRSYAADGVSNPQIYMTSYADARYCGSETIKCYESWYY
jgi:hypothetical protein